MFYLKYNNVKEKKMSAKENLNVVQKMHEFFNKSDFNSFINLFTDNPSQLNVPSNQKFSGRDGIKQSFNMWKKAFSDARYDVKNMVANDEYVVTEFNGIGTSDGVFETPMGKFDPTGKKVSIPFVEIVKIKNGKIESSKLYFDTASMMTQLGVSAHEEHAV
jgi:steroid delta-isomerase-like uncharacterized protein